MAQHPLTRSVEPAPQAGRVRPSVLLWGIFAAPVACALHTVIGVPLSRWSCPSDVLPAPNAGWVRPMLIAIGVVALLIALSGLAVGIRAWRRTHAEHRGGAAALLEVGEGRTRFLALWAVLISGLFAAAVVFNIVSLAIVPLCAS